MSKSEIELLNEIFGSDMMGAPKPADWVEGRTFRGQEIFWCEMCGCESVEFDCCNGSACNSGGCDKCIGDLIDFNKGVRD